MATIPVYERRTTPGATQQAARISDGGAGSGLASIGRSLQGAGEMVFAMDERERKLAEQKAEDQAALAASNALSEGENFWNQRSTELKQGYTVGGEDLRQKSDTEFKAWMEEQKRALPTEKSRMWFEQNANRMRARLNQDLFNHQDRAATDKVVEDTKAGMDADFQVLARDPDRFNEVVGRRLEAIGAQSRIPEAKRLEIGRAYKQEAANAAETGQMQRDPAGWLQSRTVRGGSAAATATIANDDELTALVMQQESGGKRFGKGGQVLTSPAGAKGEMQVMDATNRDPGYGVTPARDDSLDERARVGRDYLKAMLREYNGDQAKALAAYNAGPGAVNDAVRNGGANWLAQLPAETQNYVKSITAKAGGSGPQPVEPGNIDLGNRPRVRNADGSISTVRSLGVNIDGQEVLIPTVSDDGRIMSDDEAIAEYKRTGRHLGKFKSAADSTAYAKRLHEQQAATVGDAGTIQREDAPSTFRDLPYQRQQQLVDEAERRIRQDQAQQRSQADRLMADATAMHKDGKQDPFNLTPEYFDRSYGADGPRQFAAYKAGQAMASDIGAYATQTDAQIATSLQASTPPAGEGYAAADARQQVRVAAAQQVVKQRRDDPMQFAMRNGLTQAQPIDMGKPENIGQELNRRIGTAQVMRDQFGAPLRPLTNAEAAQMSAALRAFPTQQKLNYLDAVRVGLLNDSQGYRAVMGQIAPDSPVTAVAGSILVKQNNLVESRMLGADTVLQPRNVAGIILEGEAILNPTKGDRAQDGRGGKFPMPKEPDLELAFSDAVGTAFRGDAAGYSAAYQAFKAYYAGKASRSGILSEAIDSKLSHEAALAVTGGVIDYNGAGQVLKPWGMADADFKNRVSVEFDKAMTANGMKGRPEDNLSAYGLQSIGEGRYLLTNGASYLNGPRGPITLDVNPAYIGQIPTDRR